MRFEDWEPIYLEIVKEFGFSVEEDREAAFVLSGLLDDERRLSDTEKRLRDIISGKSCIIIGPCFDSVATDEILSDEDNASALIATVGEGTENFFDSGNVPGMIFTDLDSYPESELLACEKGSIVFIHAHGDNIYLLKEWVPRFPRNVVPTCQCRPIQGINNWGGFTDGDRAYCTLRHFQAQTIRLIGFDFRKPCGRKNVSAAVKMKKLEWAEKIIGIA